MSISPCASEHAMTASKHSRIRRFPTGQTENPTSDCARNQLNESPKKQKNCSRHRKRDDLSSHKRRHNIQFDSTKLNEFSQNYNAQLSHSTIVAQHQTKRIGAYTHR